jgi:hypothetical protein
MPIAALFVLLSHITIFTVIGVMDGVVRLLGAGSIEFVLEQLGANSSRN